MTAIDPAALAVRDSITLTGLRVRAHHGVFDFERENGQDFVIDATVWLDVAPAAGADALAETVHYGELAIALADAVTYGLPLTELTDYAGKINAATPAGVTAAAQAVSSEQAYVVVVGQASMFVDALRVAHPDLVVIPAAELDLNSPTLGL